VCRTGARGCFLADPSRAVYLPPNDGYTLRISPADPDRFLPALQA
jgi:hypothetical protein